MKAKLKKLLDDGVISQEEFDEAKKLFEKVFHLRIYKLEYSRNHSQIRFD